MNLPAQSDPIVGSSPASEAARRHSHLDRLWPWGDSIEAQLIAFGVAWLAFVWFACWLASVLP